MGTEFQCPKCGGTDLYDNKVRVIKGIGGIYGNRQKEVLRPFCRSCDIEALPISTKSNSEVNIRAYLLSGIGLAWIISFYFSSGQFPIPALGNWNILVGFGISLTGLFSVRRKS